MQDQERTEPGRGARIALLATMTAVVVSVGGALLSVGAAVLALSAQAELDDVEQCSCNDGMNADGVAVSDVDDDPSAAAASESTTGLPKLGHSVGSPRDGALFDGVRLESGEGWIVRNRNRAWGTENTVRHLEAAITAVGDKFPKVHRVVIGDLSTQVGGSLSGHLSHQSGRDVDVGLYYRNKPPGYPRTFVRATRHNIHFRATLALVRALADTADDPTGVELVVLDYKLQKMLYRWAARHGVDVDELDRVFQYPRGPTAAAGIVRHFPGHKNHMPVRFKCPAGDRHCQPPDGLVPESFETGPEPVAAGPVDPVGG